MPKRCVRVRDSRQNASLKTQKIITQNSKLITKNLTLIIVFLALSCSGKSSDPLNRFREKGEEFGGGPASVVDESVNAFGHAAPNLTGEKDLEFVTGNSLFRVNWVTAPASTEDLDGLGPLFNARSCSSCHLRDGRGAPPRSPDEEPLSLLFQLSRPDGNGTKPDEQYGNQFNHRAILGVNAEGKVRVLYQEVPGTYPDGTTYSLRKPSYQFEDLAYGEFKMDIMVSPRIGQHLIGMGLLEAIDDSTLEAMADPADLDGNGISGRVNLVMNRKTQQEVIGRFGWKANQPTVRQQVAGAFVNDIGITSSIFPGQPCATGQPDCNEATNGGAPELSDRFLDRITLYTSTLAVPRRRNWQKLEIVKGKAAFFEAGCESCHRSKLTTGTQGEHPEFFNLTIRPYTDLLLHDMGDKLADGRPDGLATGSEWRTPPLWGMGLMETVSGHTFLLHDGRARNIEEAILWHGGEAEASKNKFMKLTKKERASIIQFIESL